MLFLQGEGSKGEEGREKKEGGWGKQKNEFERRRGSCVVEECAVRTE